MKRELIPVLAHISTPCAMDLIKLVAYELQPCRSQDIVSLYNWTIRNAQSLYQNIPLKNIVSELGVLCRAFGLQNLSFGALWATLWLYVIHKYEMGTLYFMLSIAVAMFVNFDDRKKHSMSAYSIFNKGCQRILGTMTAEQFEKERVGNHQYHDHIQERDDGDRADGILIDDVEGGGGEGGGAPTRRAGKKARRNYEERKRRKEAYQVMVQEHQMGFGFDDWG